MTRLEVTKTHKLYIKGAFPRSESGRSLPVADAKGKVYAHMSHASRKDLRDAVTAAQGALPGWKARVAYNRGQILYRMGEMLEGKGEEFAKAIRDVQGVDLRNARKEVSASADRLVAYAGWADKFQQVLGCNNPVAGPHYNFSVPEATGVICVVAPDEPSLLGLVSLIAPALCAGNTIVAVGSETNPVPTSLLGEVCATSDVPAGVLNLLTGQREELIPHIAGHRDIDGVFSANLPATQAKALRAGMAENVKRVRTITVDADGWTDPGVSETPWWIEPFVEIKTIWHPAAS
ncbi:MAG: aldehyde dehydrogenase family protein [Phycisphaerales bacterium]